MQPVSLKVWAFKPNAFTGIGYIFGSLISFWTHSEYCHVGVEIVGKGYYEADFCTGVVKLPQALKGGELVFSTITFGEIVNWLDSQIDKHYDWLGILGFLFNTTEAARERGKRWFCSELVVALLRKIGFKILSKIPACKIYPGRLTDYLLASKTNLGLSYRV